MTKLKSRLKIYLDDVVAAGGVAEAIFAACCLSETCASGYSQSSESAPTFRKEWNEGLSLEDYVRRAFEGGSMKYIDHADGRMVCAVEVTEAEPGEWVTADGEAIDADAVIHDRGGGHSALGCWSAESVVELVCPSADDAIEHPIETAEMAREVIDAHGACSDLSAWRTLVSRLQYTGDVLREIDADDIH